MIRQLLARLTCEVAGHRVIVEPIDDAPVAWCERCGEYLRATVRDPAAVEAYGCEPETRWRR